MSNNTLCGAAAPDTGGGGWTDPVRQWARTTSASSMMVVDADRRLLWANNRALDALQDGRDVRLSNGCVALGPAGATEAFAAVLARTETLEAWCLAREDGDGCVLFKVERIAGGGPLYAVSFHGTGTDFRLVWADFSGVFGLTPTEHRVVQLLLNGCSAAEAASELAVSIETIRTHVRRTYAKLDVNSREALFLRLAPFRVL